MSVRSTVGRVTGPLGQWYGSLSKQGRRNVIAFAALAPVLLWLLLYKYIALVYNVFLSFNDMSYTGAMSFVGLRNWMTLLEDPVFGIALRNTVVLFTTIPVSVILALGIALLLDRKFPFRNAFRSIFFLPYITMMVAIAVIWRYMFKTEGGVINYFLIEAGLISQGISWLGDSTWAILAVFSIQVWKTIGFYVVILLAGLSNIPPQLYQVARIDGASRFQRFFYITLPLLKSTIGVCMLVGLVISFRLFDLIKVLTDGGPGRGTEIILTWIYKQAFLFGEFGYAAVLSVVMVVLTLFFAFVGTKLQRGSYL